MKKIFIMLMAAVAVVACKKNDPEPFIDAPVEVKIAQDGSEVSFTVSSSDAWTAVVPPAAEWLTVAPTSGDAGQTEVKVSATAYDGSDSRETTLVITAGEVVREVSITQVGIYTSVFKDTLTNVVALSPRVKIVDDIEYNAMVSVAILGDNLIVCSGDGSAPTILDKKTGENKGKLNIGDIKCFSVANDDAGHLLISNRIAYSTTTWAYAGGNWLVYYMSSTTDTPHKVIDSAAIPYGCVGAAITCRGDVTADALIGAPTEFPGLTAVNEVTYATIKGGKQSGGLNNISIKGLPGLSYAQGCWDTAPSNFPAFVFKSASLTDGAMIGWFDDNKIWDVTSTGDATINSNYVAVSVMSNLIAADVRDGWFAYIGGAWFPENGNAPEVMVYDANNHKYVIPTSTNGGEQVCTTADVAIEAVEGGANVYYVDYNCNIIEGIFVPAFVE